MLAGQNWCSRVLAHGHHPIRVTSCLGGRLPRLGLREQIEWILQPVMLRQDFFTKEIRRLLHGGKVAVRKDSQSPVLPRARLAYDACPNAGSTAIVPKLEPPPGVAPN